MTIKRAMLFLLMTFVLLACSAFHVTPVPPPAIQPYAQEITRAQSLNLQKVGAVSAQVFGSPMDVEAEIKRRANASGAPYYLIIMMSDSIYPGIWYANALLYQ
ncbi:biofilm peroxide resistance protein BsmA [Yersinia massiliensis]|uniref:Biofilm peroxide resistance protein BsmA n=1 Tax=Yersinia massiliensis TaxID=419257 RepID=A0AA91B7F6_9GAMM|nr:MULTISPECIES: biofilm peroxide resistance protein BsmA [Yersinia]MDA5549234.1 biofilm peroxide resistance protein BsmA [Yersinia massiliensis]NIL27022.1 biofilm peroxide resistance protein BsmA [Yersinia massiliensis]OWF71490.1 biofilm peroxide resistance protein BsmA [Yersinia frederiksenii]PHZ23219.1 biofilm peroxide resistance protein BsmA [Yersinia massiliensis]UZM78688.1 biofilm peroxide resistance protein BsmA [Yersinia massiliensis]